MKANMSHLSMHEAVELFESRPIVNTPRTVNYEDGFNVQPIHDTPPNKFSKHYTILQRTKSIISGCNLYE